MAGRRASSLLVALIPLLVTFGATPAASADSYRHGVVVDATKHGKVHVEVPDGGSQCADTTARFRNKPRRWTATLTLSCLRGARSIQVGAITQHRSFSDDALLDGVTCCQAPTLSPKVRRG